MHIVRGQKNQDKKHAMNFIAFCTVELEQKIKDVGKKSLIVAFLFKLPEKKIREKMSGNWEKRYKF